MDIEVLEVVEDGPQVGAESSGRRVEDRPLWKMRGIWGTLGGSQL